MEILEVVSIGSFVGLLYLSLEIDKDFKRLNERVDSLTDRIYELEGGDNQTEHELNLIDSFYGTRDEERKS